MRMIADIISCLYMILFVVSLIPATLIGMIFSFCYRKTLSSKKSIIYSTIFAPVITPISLFFSPMSWSSFGLSLSLGGYLFFSIFALCFTPLIAAFRLKRIKSVQKKDASKETYWIVDIFYFIAISTILGFIWLCIFGK